MTGTMETEHDIGSPIEGARVREQAVCWDS